MDEKRMAEMKIRQLKQRGSAADYLAEYRYQAAKLNWGKEAHIAQVYLGLKSEVKDAMVNIRPKPKDLNELANIAVEIDNQQYERRKEKQAEKHGGSYNPRWNIKQQSANQGKPETPTKMAIRTQTLGMTRSLYNTTDLRKDRTAKHGWYPHPDSSIREPQDDLLTEEDAKAGDTPQIPIPHKTKANEYRRKARENPEYREKERKRE
ncbi:hypothetical protein LZL87_014269 [Fusarium oxysporum]|nr:hypothetical protein LZL87_014269 [Fusarium oxysporum]